MEIKGLPEDLEEAIETFLGFYLKDPELKQIHKIDESVWMSWTHHAAGQFLRNSWYLWWYENHVVKGWPKEKPKLVEFFNNLGIVYADDMSGIILSSVWRRVNNFPIELEKQVEKYKNYWKTQGYKDGIPRR